MEIVLYPDPVLRKEAEEITEINQEIKDLANTMSQLMYEAPGIGLAAPQVGVSKRLFVMDLGEDPETGRKPELFVFINPKITESQGMMKYEEGCLSMPGIRELVERPSEITVTALDIDGNEFSVTQSGLFAICVQHEIDHLDGVLFTDHLSGLKRKLANKKLEKYFGTSKG